MFYGDKKRIGKEGRKQKHTDFKGIRDNHGLHCKKATQLCPIPDIENDNAKVDEK